MANTTGKKFGGRKKGSRNKRTLDARKLAEDLGVDPLEVLLRAAAGDWEWFGISKKAIGGLPARWKLQFRSDNAKDAAPYLHAKLKNIEHSGKIGGGLVAQIMDDIGGNVEEEDES